MASKMQWKQGKGCNFLYNRVVISCIMVVRVVISSITGYSDYVGPVSSNEESCTSIEAAAAAENI